MKARVATIFIAWSVCATPVGAQVDQCLELVRLSRMSSRTIMSQSQFTSTLNAYCDEREQVDARSGSADVSGFGSASAARTEASYAKFCSKSTDDRGNESDYQEYVEGVQPGAYAAYAACTTARENDAVQYEMGQAPTRDRLVLGVWNRTEIQATADLEWSGSGPVTCEWTSREVTPEGRARLQPNDARGRRARLQPNERATLECRRNAFDVAPIREPDSVNVIRVDGGRAPMLVIPWSKYGPDDAPVMTLEKIRRGLDDVVAELQNEIGWLRGEVANQTIGFGSREMMDSEEVHEARSAGLVTAVVQATGGTMRRGICGWVAGDRDSLASADARRAGGRPLRMEVAEVNGDTNIPGGSFSMPVRAGEFWVVGQCAGGAARSEVATFFQPLELGPAGP